MKYDKDHVGEIVKALENGDGRVRACKAAGIHYSTFLDWLEHKPEFSEAIKKAERCGLSRVRDLAQRGIIEKFTSHWQAAAWWLERNYPAEFGRREEVLHSGRVDSGLTLDEIIGEGISLEERKSIRAMLLAKATKTGKSVEPEGGSDGEDGEG